MQMPTQHKSDKPYDIADLLKNIISNFYFEYEGQMYKQKEGLPMGTSISGPLAIIYMNMVEQQLLTSSPRLCLYARYVDDIFILTTCKEEAENIFNMINNIDTHINFTIEHPQNNTKLSLLDFTVTTNPTSTPTFEFYKKVPESPFLYTRIHPFQHNQNKTL